MLEKNKVIPEMTIKSFIEEDKINAAFIRDLLQNAIIIPKPGKQQIIDIATDNLEAIYKSAIRIHGEQEINRAQTDDIADTEQDSLIYDTLGYLPSGS